MSEHRFDVVVLGAGPAGEVAAGRLSERGLRVAIVESERVGGECAFWACMPSKALLRPAQALDEVGRVPGAAEAVTAPLDVVAALKRRDDVVHNLSDEGQMPWLQDQGIALFRGWGRLDGERRVRVGDAVLLAERAVVLATGSAAAMPPISGLAEACPWNNRQATTAHQAPGSMIVLGGGVVGVELAQAWSSLGTAVTLVEALPRLLSREEAFASEQVTDALRECGVDIRLGVKAVRVSRDAARAQVELDDGASVTGEEILVAIGRRPLSEDIGLPSVGVPEGGFIDVDDCLRVAPHRWLYAIGDVNGRTLLTHMGKYQAAIAVEAIMGGAMPLLSDGALSPRVVFTEPQVAAVGLTEEMANERGLRFTVVEHASSGTAGGSFYGRNAPGTSRLIIDDERRVVVGATFTGADVAEWLHAATIAVVAEVPVDRLRHAVPAFPTRSEVWLRLLDKYEAARQ